MHYSIGLKVPLGALPAAYFSCQRSKSNGPFAEREGTVHETLMPHLQRALSQYWQMIQMQAKVVGLEAALDAMERRLDPRGAIRMAFRVRDEGKPKAFGEGRHLRRRDHISA